MKNKYRIIQVILIVLIFLLIGFYWTQASSTYEIVATSPDITSVGNTDTIKIDSFLNKNIIDIHYDINNNGTKVNEGNFGYRILTGDGQSISSIPYIYSKNSGFNGNEVDVYIDGNLLLKEISKGTQLVTTFKISFYQTIIVPGELPEEIAVGNERTIILNIPNTNTSLASIGNFDLTPYYVNQHTALSNLKLNNYNSATNTYDYSLNISMGPEETLKNYVYDISMLTDSFPFINMKSLSSSNSVVIQTVTNSPYISVTAGKTINNPVTNNAYNLGNIIKFIVSANRANSTTSSASQGVYSITFNSLSDAGEAVHVNLSVNLNMEAKKMGTRNLYETNGKEVINKTIGDDGLNLDMSFEFIPYRLLVKNESGQIVNTVSFDQITLNEYKNFTGEIFEKGFHFNEDTPAGFYTIEAYGLDNGLKLDDNDNVIAPTEEEITLFAKYTTYIDTTLAHTLIISDNGSPLTVSNNKEVSVNIPTDNSNSTNVFLLDGFLSNANNKLDSKFTYKVVSNLENMNLISDGSVILNENMLTIKGNITHDSVYLLVYPSTAGCSYVYKININHIALSDLVLALASDGSSFKTPFSGVNGEISYITPSIKINGIVGNIENYSYHYNLYVLTNGSYIPLSNSNIYIDKNITITNEQNEQVKVDRLTLTDAAPVGNYMIKATLDNSPNVSATLYFEIVYDSTTTTPPVYTVNITNTQTQIAVPSSAGKQNEIAITYQVLKDGVASNIIPTFSISGDLKASVSNNKIIVKSGATVGNNIILTANVSNPNDGTLLATKSKTFKLVAQTVDNDDTIVDDPDGNPDPGGGTNPDDDDDDDGGPQTTIPTKITIDGYSKDTLAYLLFNKSAGEIKTLTYKCYDAKGNIINNPSIAINVVATDNTGYSVSTDYTNKKINIASNGLSNKKSITINFTNSNTLIRTLTLELRKNSIYNCSLKILQTNIERTGKITAQATFTNNGLIDLKVLLAVVCYDKNDKIVAKAITPTVVASGKSLESPIEAKITLPADIKDVVIKAFLLDGTTLDDSVGYYTGAVTITNREDY